MDIFDFDNVKAEKANAMLRYRRLQSIAKLFRFIELCLALVFISWISTRLPFVLKISGEYFRQLSAVIVSPIFAFVLVNIIILTLFANSGGAGNDAEAELYKEFFKNSETRTELRSENHTMSPETQEILYEDKQIIGEVNTVIAPTSENKEVAMVIKNTESEMETKLYRRSHSVTLSRDCSEMHCAKLRRSETEKLRKIMNSGEEPAVELYAVDELSNEEFQSFIDEFIAKKMKVRREEYLSVVLQN